MRYLLLPLAVFIASSTSGCLLNANAASKVAAGRTHIPVEGNVKSISAPDLADAIRTMGTWPIYRVEVIDHDHVTAYDRPNDPFSLTFIERVNGKWQEKGGVLVTP